MSDDQLPVYRKSIVKTSLLCQLTKEVSPSRGVDLILTQKTNNDIQLMLTILAGETTLNHPVNLMSMFFRKRSTNWKRLENANGVLYRIFYDHSGLESHKQVVVPDQVMLEIIRSLHKNPMQGHPASKTYYTNYVKITTLQTLLKKHKKY